MPSILDIMQWTDRVDSYLCFRIKLSKYNNNAQKLHSTQILAMVCSLHYLLIETSLNWTRCLSACRPRRLRPHQPRRHPRCLLPRVRLRGPGPVCCGRRRGTRRGTCSSTSRQSCRLWARARRTTPRRAGPGTCPCGATPCRTRTRTGSTCSPAPEVREGT